MASTEKDQAAIEQAKKLQNIPWCEEYEKMISGMLYDSLVPDLEASRFRARAWCNKYNTWFPHSDPSADFSTLASVRTTQLAQIIGSLGTDIFIEPPFTIDYGCNLTLGDRFYANFNFCVLDCALVTIGDRVMVGPNVSIFAATHEVDVESRRRNIEFAKPVRIGDDCWIGGHSVILPGVTIGEGCTVAASSVVTRDVPAWSVVMGSPARVVKTVRPLGKFEGEAEFEAKERMG